MEQGNGTVKGRQSNRQALWEPIIYSYFFLLQVRNLAVVILDRASGDYAATIAAAQRAKNAGIEIIAVAVGKEVNDAEITAIASQPSERYKITLSDYSEGADLKHKFYSLICPWKGGEGYKTEDNKLAITDIATDLDQR